MGFELKNKDFIKKNQKITKLLTIVLIGVLILVISIPTKGISKDYSMGNNVLEKDDSTYRNDEEEFARYYENRLKEILEKTYGKGNIDVMITLSSKGNSNSFFDENNISYNVNGVLVVAKVENERALSDITFSVCALFDLPTHKVAVILKR